MIIPKIVYNSTTLNFTYPPTNKPATFRRHREGADLYSTLGIHQAVTFRVDRFLAIQFPNVPPADISAIDTFIAWAMLGGDFDYYPDATVGSFYTVHLIDTDWDPQMAFKGFYKFTLVVRESITS